MIKLDQETLRKIQLIQLEMLVEVDRICRKCNIHYNIIAGTLLGAIRHKGYIPWDDDADVALLRDEYDRFRLACEIELDQEKFYFQDHINTPGYRWGYGKLRRKGTVFLREFQEHMPYKQGIFIDIFPLDFVPDNRLLRCINNFHCFCIRKLLWSAVGRKAEKNCFLRWWYTLLYQIPIHKIWKHYEKFMRQGNRKETKFVRILTFPTPNREFGYLYRWYENSCDIVFEGFHFKGIQQWDEYLSFKFGDYMSLPPIELRKTHPVSALKII